jgi:hypothetical protein
MGEIAYEFGHHLYPANLLEQRLFIVRSGKRCPYFLLGSIFPANFGATAREFDVCISIRVPVFQDEL